MNKLKKVYLVLSIFIICIRGFSQSFDRQIFNPVSQKVFSATPDVMAFQRYNLNKVNLYTGKVDVDIPIYEIEAGNIKIPITLNYDTSGIKIDDHASSVGQGWFLNAGGSIIRIINDIPDNEVTIATTYSSEENGVHIFPYVKDRGFNRKRSGNIPVFSPYWRYSNFQNDSPIFLYREDNNETDIDGENGHYWSDWAPLDSFQSTIDDMSPDTFIVNAPGLNSKFIAVNQALQTDIYPNNNSGFLTTFLDNSGLKMNSLKIDKRDISGFGFYNYVDLGENNLNLLNANPYHQITASKKIKDFFEFNIVNTKGIKYSFNEVEVNEDFSRPYGVIPMPNGNCIGSDAINSYHANYYNKRIHTWNLSKIEDDQTNNIVNLSYETYSNSNIENNILVNTKVDLSINTPQNESQLNKCILTPYDPNDPYVNLKMRSMIKNPQKKRLISISFPEGTVTFQYGLNRLDYLGEKALTGIILKDIHDVVVKQYAFEYSYFNSKENCNDPDCKRLKLDKIRNISQNNLSNDYSFEYDETNKLPKRGSLEHDFLGFYNNNGAADNNSNVLMSPTLYFYKNNYANSVLPFQLVNNSTFQIIPGNYSLIPNNYSLAGLLKKIIYPTGGSVEYEYENNQFQYLGENYISGGARIKSQKLVDNNVVVKKNIYKYVDENGKSTGFINNIPKFANIIEFYKDSMMAKSFSVFDVAKGGIELTSNSFVGYSKIKEIEEGNGFTNYEFSSPIEYPNTPEIRSEYSTNDTNCTLCECLFLKNCSYPMLTYINNDNRRGKIITKSTYNDDNQILENEVNEYYYRIIKDIPISKGISAFYNMYHDVCDSNYTFDYGFMIKSNLLISQDLLTKRTNYKYFNGNIVKTFTDFNYDSNYPFITSQVYNTGMSNIKIEQSYPYFSSQLTTYPVFSNLISKNRIDEVVEEKMYKDNNLIETKHVNYNDFGNGLILSKSISESKNGQSLEEQAVIDIRDDKGNILQNHNKAGVYTSIIWGYNKTHPIAKIENATYSSITPGLITSAQTASDSGVEADLITSLSALRTALPSAMVTTYTYKPLIGVSTITDPKGDTITYTYDSFGRLQNVKDKDGNILSENEYHYKN